MCVSVVVFVCVCVLVCLKGLLLESLEWSTFETTGSEHRSSCVFASHSPLYVNLNLFFPVSGGMLASSNDCGLLPM